MKNKLLAFMQILVMFLWLKEDHVILAFIFFVMITILDRATKTTMKDIIEEQDFLIKLQEAIIEHVKKDIEECE